MMVKMEEGFNNEENANGQRQHFLQRGQYRSGTGVQYFCSTTTAFPPGGLKHGFRGKWNSRGGSQVSHKGTVRGLRMEK